MPPKDWPGLISSQINYGVSQGHYRPIEPAPLSSLQAPTSHLRYLSMGLWGCCLPWKTVNPFQQLPARQTIPFVNARTITQAILPFAAPEIDSAFLWVPPFPLSWAMLFNAFILLISFTLRPVKALSWASQLGHWRKGTLSSDPCVSLFSSAQSYCLVSVGKTSAHPFSCWCCGRLQQFLFAK